MDREILYALICIGALLFIIVLINAMIGLQEFCKELRYLNAEINRTTGSEREQWKCRKKRHMMSLIPFYRYFKR